MADFVALEGYPGCSHDSIFIPHHLGKNMSGQIIATSHDLTPKGS